MSFETNGFRVERGIANMETVVAIRRGILQIMQSHVELDPADPLAIDKGFLSLAAKSSQLKNNCYRLFGKLAAIPRMLADPGIARVVNELGFTDSTVQSYSVFCLEPGNTCNSFMPHQDLRDRTSLDSLLLWLPLSAGPRIGGMACYTGTHRRGPIHHEITADGKPFISPSIFSTATRVDITDFQLGDVVFMDPYLIHESIQNTGSVVRWTAVIKLDSTKNLKHLAESPYPFPIGEYIDLRTNELRLRRN